MHRGPRRLGAARRLCPRACPALPARGAARVLSALCSPGSFGGYRSDLPAGFPGQLLVPEPPPDTVLLASERAAGEVLHPSSAPASSANCPCSDQVGQLELIPLLHESLSELVDL